ncbi:integrase [Rhizobium skierniewicense]|uniref:Integrase n=1 Tax=Rhizobium skierniewicense TaxID=984260 RepID=A0A7W6CCQ5_9HYPH|nr:integrase arm-type DNA-binding domain-containing protein [Rhizobium skierniewicense]MBB3947039.1 integrase [Rhizobium skierniewicense]
MLTDTAIKKAKARDKAYKLADTNGLHLFVATSGSKSWRYRYYFADKEKLLVLGSYPDVSLVDARRLRDDARKLLKDGKDPSALKKLEKVIGRKQAGETFQALAEEWHEHTKPTWTDRHAAEVLTTLKRDVFPLLGDLPIRSIDAPTILGVLRLVEKRGAVETAKRLRQRISAVFVYAISSGRADTDPSAVVEGALAPLEKGRQPSIITLQGVRQILADVNNTPGRGYNKLAIRLLALTAVRPGVLAETPWSEFDELDPENPVWIIPAARMKLKKRLKNEEAYDHHVPLCTQAMELIDVLRRVNGRFPFVFPNLRKPRQPMSTNTMGYMLNRAGYHSRHVPHGFRASFSSIMNERLPQESKIIDLMLAHKPKDAVEGAYNRAQHAQRRREIAQEYADLILTGAPSAAQLLMGPIRVVNSKLETGARVTKLKKAKRVA